MTRSWCAARSLAVLAWLVCAPAYAEPPPDPLQAYMGNTIACTGRATCRIWLLGDARYVLFGTDAIGHPGHVVPGDAPGQSCLQPDDFPIAMPDGYAPPIPPPTRICLSLGPHDIGDRWDAPAALRAADGSGRLTLLVGRR